MGKELIDSNKMTIPKGGGAYKGLKNDMDINLFSGSGTVQIPVYTSPCRDCEPNINLEYSTAGGNGVFGMGFSLDIPAISRKTSKSIPRYDETDIFVMEGKGELVLKACNRNADEVTERIYQLRYEKDFSDIRYYEKIQSGRIEDSYWKVTDRHQTVFLFGSSESERIADSDREEHVFSWNLSESTDRFGNKTKYFYNPDGIIQRIQYGNYYIEEKSEQWLFGVEFHYQNKRVDRFRSYNSGFLIETKVLCTEISMFHDMENGKETVRRMQFSYQVENGISLMQKISSEGIQKDADGLVRSLHEPDLCFTFIPFEWKEKTFHRLETENNLPFLVNAAGYSMIDLYGEGIAGLFYAGKNALYYYRPLGGYRYESPLLLKEFPIHRELDSGRAALTSLEGNGKYELVLHEEAANGYYELGEDGKWGGFHVFEQECNEWGNPWREEADLQGDHLSHLMVTDGKWLRYYPSGKKSGVGTPVICEIPEGFPHMTQNSAEEVVRFVDFFGDGLAHRIRVKNGSVECFPNLGYGRFGEKVEIMGAPVFSEGLDASRLFFADIDGTGTADMIYACPDHLLIYWNRSGNAFSGPEPLKLPEMYTRLDRISFEDITGTGTNCLVFSKMDQEIRHYCYDFTSGQKPYMLCRMDNNTGVVTELSYASSTEFFLKDKKCGTEWKQKPPFPVQLIAKKKVSDTISRNVITTEYRYKNGLYDYEENEFKGFGTIDQKITQSNEYWKDGMEPVLVRKWFYTGLDVSEEYNKADRRALDMDSAAFAGEGRKEAEKALWGLQIREETYGRDTDVPLDAVQAGYRVEELQRPTENSRGIYFAHPGERLHYHYEGECLDPVITHKFYLELDEYGNVLKECKVHYPRRTGNSAPPGVPGALLEKQRRLHVTETVRAYAVCTEGARLLELPSFVKRYRMEGLRCREYFTSEEIRGELKAAAENMISYGENFTAGRRQAKLVHMERTFYWDSDRERCLPLGETGKHALVHHTEAAVFPEKFLKDRGWFQPEMLERVCGYCLQDGHWWKMGDTVRYYGNREFFLPYCEEMDRPYKRTCVKYDTYSLMPVEITQYVKEGVSNTVTASIDYTVMQYWQVTDQNDNTAQVIYDALGRVIASTGYGTADGILEGDGDVSEYVRKDMDLEGVLADPKACVQDMTGFYYYDQLAYQERKQPVSSILLTRETYRSSRREEVINCQVCYWDGFGHQSEEKYKYDENKWIVKNRTVYDGNGKELLIYPSFFADSPYYEYSEIPLPPVRQHYDSMGRTVKKEIPDTGIEGLSYAYLYSRTEYHPWEIREYDENQCLADSGYYKDFLARYPQNPDKYQIDKRNALQKALCFSNVGKTYFLDGKGSRIGDMLQPGAEFAEYGYDGCRHLVTVADDRQRSRKNCNLMYHRDMLGNILCTKSCDSGCTYEITDNHDNQVYAVNAEGVHKTITYDGLNRPLETFVDSVGVTERISYGEQSADSREKNLRGQAVQIQDQAGVVQFHAYTFRGQIKRKSRRLCCRYEKEVDWRTENPLEIEGFEESFEYNAAGEVIERNAPDGVSYLYEYDYLGLLKKVSKLESTLAEPIIENIVYNEDGKRQEIKYGNQTVTKYRYNKITGRPETMKAVKSSGKIIQFLSYTYDPVGNISCIRDEAAEDRVSNSQVVEPLWEYTYDSDYRLIQAGGRELAGHSHDFQNMASYRREYTYDTGGNLCRMAHKSPAGSHVLDMEMEADSNRIIRAECGGGGWNPEQGISYDRAGNIRKMPGIRSLEWNQEGYLAHAVVISRGNEENDEEFYVYDTQGERVRKISKRRTAEGRFAVTEKIYLDGYCVQRETGNGILTERSSMAVECQDSTAAIVYHFIKEKRVGPTDYESTSRIHYLVENHIHAVCVELNEKEEIISFEEYYPFGETAFIWTNKSEVSLKEYRYCNKERDSVTGLYYYGSRYYHAAYGRMISADEPGYIREGDSLSINLYAYCKNNPIVRMDLSGNCSTFIFHGKDQEYRAVKEAKSFQPKAYTGPAANKKLPAGKDFVSQWGRMQSTATSTIVIYQHGNPKSITGVPMSRMDSTKAASELVLLSCNTASPTTIRTFTEVSGGGRKYSYQPGANPPVHNTAQRFLLQFPNIKRVIGSRGFHMGMASEFRGGILASHNAVTSGGGHELEGLEDSEARFIMYTRGEDGEPVETPLKASYGNISEIVADARLKKP